MKDIISFDVKLTPNQKSAQDKLNQVHQLYDEIEKLLGTQDVFKRPHLFMTLPPKKERQTNEDCVRDCKTQDELAKVLVGLCDRAIQSRLGGVNFTTDAELVKEWLKKPHEADFDAK